MTDLANAAPAPASATRANNITLLLLVALFVLPVVAATALYLTGWQPQSTSNRGALISPARAVQDVEMQTLAGAPFRFAQLKDKWVLVYFGRSDCPAACQRSLYMMRQSHTAVGKEKDRVARVLVLLDAKIPAADQPALQPTLQNFPGTLVVGGVASGALLDQFSAGSGKQSGSEIYLIDPLGNLILRYDAALDNPGIHKDLTRLLKNSWVG